MSAGATTCCDPVAGTFTKKWSAAKEEFGPVWVRERRAYRLLAGLDVTPTVLETSPRLIVTTLHAPLTTWLHNEGEGRTPDERQRLATDLRSAIAVVHARGICHRDLHAENVVVDGSRPLLVDFELALFGVDPMGPCYDLVGATAMLRKPYAHHQHPQHPVHWHQGPSELSSLAAALEAP